MDIDMENSSAEIEPQKNGIESSDAEWDDVIADLIELYADEFQINTAVKRKAFHAFQYPTPLTIKDVVKVHVLPFLPAKSLAKFKTVSKGWNRWISGPFLAHKQSYLFKKMSGFFCQHGEYTPTFVTLNPKACGVPAPSVSFMSEHLVVLRSSSHGLLLCQGVGGDDYYVCNPVNKGWEKLPRPSCYHHCDPAVVLAFEPSEMNFSAHFEVVCAFPLIDVPIVYFDIYSSRQRAWRCSAADCIELGDSSVTLKGGFYAKRMAYWETSLGNILAFDMESEVCGVLPLPPAPNGVLAQMKGALCYIQVRNGEEMNGGSYYIDIYGGMDMSLKQSVEAEFRLGGQRVVGQECRVLPSVSGDVVIVLVGCVMYAYHLRKREVEVISKNGDLEAKYLPYVNSLVSLAH